MEMLDKYKEVAATQPTQPSSITGGVNPPKSNSSAANYYELAKNQEYGKLLDSEIQLENAKSNALKYTQSQINAQGFGGSGVGSSMQGSVYNKYLNAAANMKNDYNNAIRTLDYQQAQEQEAKADDRFQSITTMIGTADDIDSLNNMLSDYGYGSYKNGVFELSKNKPEGMSDDDWYQLKYYYNLQKNAIENNNNNTAYYGSLQALQNATYVGNDGLAHTIGDTEHGFNEEAKYLTAMATQGNIENGSVIRVQNGKGDVIYLQYTKNGYVFVNEEAYNNSSIKHKLTWQNKSKGSSARANWE